MYWNFGGNFQPVVTVCKYSKWTKCLTSFIKYIWFEVVTDVADCLANEAVLWTILAVLLIFITIAYLVYWKSQWTREVKRNQEKFKAVNHKIHDIELKVDIITYKTQYGIWPSQCLQEKNTLSNVKNYRFGVSQFPLENSWIKNLLARTNKKKYALEKYSNMQRNIVENCSRVDESNFPPSDCDHKLLGDAEKNDAFDYNSAYQNNAEGNLGELLQSVDNSRGNSLIIPPESNLRDRSKNYILHAKENNLGTRNNNLSQRKLFTLDNFPFGQKKFAYNKDLKVIASTANMTVFSNTLLPGLQENIPNAPSKTSHSLSKSHETLFDIQKKLKTLYTTIHNYNTKNSLIPMLVLDSNSNRSHTSEAVSFKVDKSTEDALLLDNSKQSSKDINPPQIVNEYSNCTTTVTNKLKPTGEIKSRNDDNHVNYNNIEETSNNSLKCTTQDDKNPGDFHEEKDETDVCHQIQEFDSIMLTDTVNIPEIEVSSVAFEEVKPLDDSTSALLQEALKFKKQILSNVEFQDNGIDIKDEYTLNRSETNSESSLRPSHLKFESKILDMITEESSVSSSTEKRGDLHSCKILEKNKSSQDKALLSNEKTKRTGSKNTIFNSELLTDEKIKKQKEGNCLSKVSSKSSNAEPSSNRKFPSCFSTIFLCNNQDITNHCKQTQDNATELDPKSSQDFISLTESSSDVSVNRLINKLIENERKLKNQNQLLEPEKKTTNSSTQNFTNSDNAELLSSPIELTNSTVSCDIEVFEQPKPEPIIDENIKYGDIFNEDSSRIKCLREIKNVAKKLIDSVLDIKNNEDYNPSKIETHSDILSNSEIKEIIEVSNIDSCTDKYGIDSDSSANEKCIKWKSNRTEQYDTLHTSKESYGTLDSSSSSNVQKSLKEHNFDCNNRKPSRAKSNLDLTTGDKLQFKSTHRRSRSYVNPRAIRDEPEHNAEVATSISNKLSVFKNFDKSSQDNLKIEVDIKRIKSSETLCSKSWANSIQKSISLQDGRITVTKDCSYEMAINSNKKNYIENESSLETIPLSYSSSKSCIPMMKNRIAPSKNEETYLRNPEELSIKVSLENQTQAMICQAGTDKDEICSLSIDREKTYPEKFTNFSESENLKNFEQNAIMYYNLISEDRLISNYINQKNLLDTTVEELNVLDEVVRSRVNDTASAIPETINRPITCVISDELSELNTLNSFVFQNTISSLSPYKIERKETEVLVKPSTLDISTSMTNFPCVYHFEEDDKLNDVKIFEISDELTKEECIKYLQMFNQDSNHDQSTNTHDFCNKFLEDM